MFQEVQHSALFLKKANQNALCFTWSLGFDKKLREEVIEVRAHLNNFLQVSCYLGLFGDRASYRQVSWCHVSLGPTAALPLTAFKPPSFHSWCPFSEVLLSHAMLLWPELRATMLFLHNGPPVHLFFKLCRSPWSLIRIILTFLILKYIFLKSYFSVFSILRHTPPPTSCFWNWN